MSHSLDLLGDRIANKLDNLHPILQEGGLASGHVPEVHSQFNK